MQLSRWTICSLWIAVCMSCGRDQPDNLNPRQELQIARDVWMSISPYNYCARMTVQSMGDSVPSVHELVVQVKKKETSGKITEFYSVGNGLETNYAYPALYVKRGDSVVMNEATNGPVELAESGMSYVIRMGLEDIERISDALARSVDIRFVSDNTISSNYEIIHAKFPTFPPLEESTVEWVIDKNTHLLMRCREKVTINGESRVIDVILTYIDDDSLRSQIDRQKIANKIITASTLASTSSIDSVQIGRIAPTWRLLTQNAQTIASQNYKGQYVLLDFWYMSCPPCISLFPELVQIDRDLNLRMVKIIGVNCIDKDLDRATAFAKRLKADHTIVGPGDSVASLFHVTSYPTIFLIDPQGRVVLREDGYEPGLYARVRNIVLKDR